MNLWVPVDACNSGPVVPPGLPVATSLYYTATTGQILFSLSTPDEFGNTAILDDDSLFVYRSGNRLVFTDGYTVNVAGNSVSLVNPAGAGEPIVFDLVSSTSTGPPGPPGTDGTDGAPGAPGASVKMDALPIVTLNVIPPLSATPDGLMLMLLVNGTAFFGVGPDAAFTVSGNVLTWTSSLYSIPAGAAVVAVYTHA